MSPNPETRNSLLIRVRDPEDREAWYEFVEIYRPVIVRLARHKGLQHADAEDLAQRVLINIGRAIERFDPEPSRGRFRTWLYRVAHNAILNALSRGAPDRAAGGETAQFLLDNRPAEEGPDSDLLRLEFRREIFHRAARQIRSEFQPSTWDAFWLTAVEGRDINATARRLGKSRGAVYAARSRVMKRLNEKIREFDEANEE